MTRMLTGRDVVVLFSSPLQFHMAMVASRLRLATKIILTRLLFLCDDENRDNGNGLSNVQGKVVLCVSFFRDSCGGGGVPVVRACLCGRSA